MCVGRGMSIVNKSFKVLGFRADPSYNTVEVDLHLRSAAGVYFSKLIFRQVE